MAKYGTMVYIDFFNWRRIFHVFNIIFSTLACSECIIILSDECFRKILSIFASSSPSKIQSPSDPQPVENP